MLDIPTQDPELTALSGLSAKYAKVRLLVPKPDKTDKAAVPVDAGLAEGASASRSGAKTKATQVDTTGRSYSYIAPLHLRCIR